MPIYNVSLMWVVFLQSKINKELRSDVTKINTKIDQANQSLSLILAELIKPNTVHPDGYATPPASVTQPTGVAQFSRVPSSVVTSSRSIVNPANVTQHVNSVPSTDSSPVMTLSLSVVNPANVTQFGNRVPLSDSSSVMTLFTSPVNPANVTQFGNSVPSTDSSPVMTLSTSSVNPANVTQYANSIPSSDSSPIMTLSTSPINTANVTHYANSVPSSVGMPSRNIANIAPSQLIPNYANYETVTTSNPVTQLPRSGILDSGQIRFIRSGSCSRRNFAAKLVVALFDEATRKRCNVSGKMGKCKLNLVLIQYVKSLAFQFYPLEYHENEKGEWAKCVVSIDEVNRRKKHAKSTFLEQN